jgi:hypothetical protein
MSKTAVLMAGAGGTPYLRQLSRDRPEYGRFGEVHRALSLAVSPVERAGATGATSVDSTTPARPHRAEPTPHRSSCHGPAAWAPSPSR